MKIGLKSSRRTLAGALGLLLALALLASMAGPVLGQPPEIPMQLYGYVSVGGLPAPEGTQVRAEIDGAAYAAQAADSQGRYGYEAVFVVPADNPATPEKDGGVPGDRVDLLVGGTLAHSRSFESGSMQVDLSVGALEERTLTTSSTTGGTVVAPGEGIFTYDEGTVVNLVAQADVDYAFVSWTGDVATVADVDSAVTTVTMNGDKTVTASFSYTGGGGGGGGGVPPSLTPTPAATPIGSPTPTPVVSPTPTGVPTPTATLTPPPSASPRPRRRRQHPRRRRRRRPRIRRLRKVGPISASS